MYLKFLSLFFIMQLTIPTQLTYAKCPQISGTYLCSVMGDLLDVSAIQIFQSTNQASLVEYEITAPSFLGNSSKIQVLPEMFNIKRDPQKLNLGVRSNFCSELNSLFVGDRASTPYLLEFFPMMASRYLFIFIYSETSQTDIFGNPPELQLIQTRGCELIIPQETNPQHDLVPPLLQERSQPFFLGKIESKSGYQHTNSPLRDEENFHTQASLYPKNSVKKRKIYSNENNYVSRPSHVKTLLPLPEFGSSKKKKPLTFSCTFCEKILTSQKYLQQHVVNIHLKRPFSCKIPKCNRSFSDPDQLEHHERDHAYPCDICGKPFKYPSRLKLHLMIHLGKKPFSCDFPRCKQTFSHESNLKRHHNIHAQERNFSCNFCDARFLRNENLNIHLHRNHKYEINL